MRRQLIITAQAVAFWPVWRWYAARVGGFGDEAWGHLAFALAVYFLWRGKSDGVGDGPGLLFPALLVLLYAASYPFLPPLLRAGVAFTALGCTASLLRFGKPFHPGTLGLLYLSLPMLPSLQFYGGYPLRALVAGVVAPLLRLGGYAVVREGTCLNWAGRLISVDAPCSGVRMLWVGLLIACALACLYELRPLRAALALASAFAVILLGNVLRAAALFYVEAGIVASPPWAHEYAGLVSFAAVAALILITVRRMGRDRLCDTRSSTPEPAR
jgi:exosortase/archaeosortase family protein